MIFFSPVLHSKLIVFLQRYSGVDFQSVVNSRSLWYNYLTTLQNKVFYLMLWSTQASYTRKVLTLQVCYATVAQLKSLLCYDSQTLQ